MLADFQCFDRLGAQLLSGTMLESIPRPAGSSLTGVTALCLDKDTLILA